MSTSTPPMLDTSVVLQAAKGFGGSQDKDARAAKHLLTQHDKFYVSSVTQAELLTTDGKDERSRFLARLPLIVKAFDKIAAELAADVTIRARRQGLLCDRCYAIIANPPPVCKKCTLQVAQQQRLNDIYIAATAEIHRVGVLYVRDRGFEALDPFFPNTTILRPPAAPPEQLALPEAADEPIPIHGKKKSKKGKAE